MIYLQLFYTFFKIGLFGFGGGYAMLSMIQGEVVTRYDWVSSQEFTDIVAISQMTPGPIGINAATYVGFTSTGSVVGSVIATFAVVLPSFILMLTISKFFLKYQKHPVVESIFSGLRPAVVGLLASAALVLMNVENFGSPTTDTYSFVISIIIFLVALLIAGVVGGYTILKINDLCIFLPPPPTGTPPSRRRRIEDTTELLVSLFFYSSLITVLLLSQFYFLANRLRFIMKTV